MVAYNFDKIVERKNTNCVKYDILNNIFGNDQLKPMWVADMDFETPEFVIEDIKRRLEHKILAYSIFPEEFFTSITNWLKRQHNWQIHKEQIVASQGVVPALASCILAFTNPGDKIIIQTPVYFPFSSSILNNGRQINNNKLRYENQEYSIDFENLEKIIDSRTKMFILCNPHNPVGRVWRRDELQKIADICLKNNILIISDEIHADLVMPEHKHIPMASLSEEIANITITTYSASKTFNLSGLSTAFAIITNPKLRQAFYNKLDDIHIAGSNVIGTVATISAFTHGEEWHKQLITYLHNNYLFVKKYFENNIDCIKIANLQGTYLLWLDCNALKMNDDELARFFIHEIGLGLNSGISFGAGGSGFMRMNIALPLSELILAVEKINCKIFDKIKNIL